MFDLSSRKPLAGILSMNMLPTPAAGRLAQDQTMAPILLRLTAATNLIHADPNAQCDLPSAFS